MAKMNEGDVEISVSLVLPVTVRMDVRWDAAEDYVGDVLAISNVALETSPAHLLQEISAEDREMIDEIARAALEGK